MSHVFAKLQLSKSIPSESHFLHARKVKISLYVKPTKRLPANHFIKLCHHCENASRRENS